MAAGTVALRPTSSYVLGGDRLYALARWLLLALLCAIVTLLYNVPLFPPPTDHLFGYVFWGYVAFAILLAACTISSRTQPILAWSYGADVLWIAALAWTTPHASENYIEVFLLPLIVAALRLKRPQVLVLSLLAVLAAIGIAFKPGAMPDGLGLASHVVMLSVLPWLCNLLSEQWSVDNRQRVALAEQQATAALQHAQSYRKRMRAMYEVAVSLNTDKHPANVLETTLAECERVFPYQAGAIIMPTGVPDQVRVIAGRHLQANEINATYTIGAGTLGTVLRGGNGGVLQNAHTEPELAALPSIATCRTVLILPLRSARRTFGLVVFGSQEAQVDVEQMDMATTLVSYGMITLQNAQLISELRTERDNLLAREEEVRKQLNRDLHDGPAQSLAAITMTLGFIKRLLANEPARVIPELDKLALVAQRANHDVRTLLFELRPLVLETQGLFPTLWQYLERFEQNTSGPKIVLEGDEEIGPMTKRVQGTLFNIVQESVNNALKHAQAKHIWIKIAKRGGDVHVTIQDDGKGFDLQAVKASYDQRGSFGLLSLEERARLVGGAAELLSAVGAGTTVKVVVPFEG
jgi:signal transduction histidine kinase